MPATDPAPLEPILRDVLDRWKSAVDAHDPARAAALFTTDAIFQGLHPYGVGPAAVAEYYASQPPGLTAAYDLQETRRLADDVVLGYATVTFSFQDRPPLAALLCVILRGTAGAWHIAHYQVSRLT